MSNHHPNGSGNPSSGSDDGDGLSNLMMASIPRRSLPPKPSPTGADPLAPDTTSLENMTIPRRKLTKKPSADRSSNGSLQQQREGSFPRRLSDGSDRGGTLSSSARPSRPKPKHVTIQSEYPFIIKIKTRGVPLDPDGIPRFRASTTAAKTTLLATSTVDSSTRTPKRARPFYKEQDTDDDDDLIDSDDEAYNARPKKLRKGASQGKTHDEKTANSSTGAVGAGHAASSFATSETSGVPMDPAPAPASSGEMVLVSQDGTPLIDSPPPGFLHTLWYSREVFLHIFVVDKIVGWKRRHVVSLEWDDPDALKFLDPTEASSIQQKTLSHPDFWNDHRKRMEVSRINVTQCPVVLTIAAEREKARALEENRKPKYTLNVSADNREDVLLVKWRGRSHMHCSWERASDIIKLDQSNSTARHKIRRYYQSQEMTLGKDWKKILEEDRATAAAIHSHGETANADVANDQADEGEEFFPSQFIEVERILTCDEHEMDMQVLAKQRALNIRAEQEALEIREEAETRTDADALQKQKSNSFLLKDLVDVRKPEDPWDPEDNVRYVVKWKGLPFAEMTWEYWRDIKRDAVEEAEDFWYRQKPPSPDEVKRLLSKPHPHVKDFRKITESKAYGVSSKPRPVADLGDGAVIPEEDENENKKGGFQLRSYQLEGVNWLLFNWWNKRSCILADGKLLVS